MLSIPNPKSRIQNPESGPLRIAMVTTTYPLRAGDSIPAFVADLAENLVADHGLDVRVIAPHHPGAPRSEVVRGVRVERFQYTLNPAHQCLAYGSGIPANLKQFPAAKWQVPGFFAAMELAILRAMDDCDLIHAHWVEPGFLAVIAKLLRRKPVVVTVHSLNLRPGSGKLYKHTLARADRVLFNSRFTMEQAQQLGYRCRGEVIYQGFDGRLFGQTQRTGAMRQRLGIPADATVVTSVGRMVPFKGMEVVAAAAGRILEGRPNVHLVIGGDGPCRPAVIRLVEGCPQQVRIHVPGALVRADVAQLLADSDLFVMPSILDSTGRTETLGVAALEAMASGLACVGSRIGGIVETIADGQTGLLVEPGNPAALAAAVCRLLDDQPQRQRLAAAGKDLAQKHFSWPALAGEVMDVYRSLSGRRL